MPTQKIKVYGTKWCGDTARARACLAKNAVEYDWCDIDADKEGCAFVEKVNKGNRSVPTIVFPDGTILVEPSNSALEAQCKKSA